MNEHHQLIFETGLCQWDPDLRKNSFLRPAFIYKLQELSSV